MQFQKISILPPQKGLKFPGGGGWGFCKAKNIKKCMKLNWNFQRGGVVLEKIPSVGEVWAFSGITHFHLLSVFLRNKGVVFMIKEQCDLRWQNTVFARTFADAIHCVQHIHSCSKN